MSQPKSLRNLDLSLLLSLDALLEERNVTRAAARLGLSQPALRRLRRHFGDELLVRAGNRFDLTPGQPTARHHHDGVSRPDGTASN